MKNTNLRKTVAVLAAALLLLTLMPSVLVSADGDNVIFPITIQQDISTNTVPFADGITAVDITSPYAFLNGTTEAYADASGQYSALVFYAKNATADEKDNVNFGISFGQNIATLVGDPAKAFLSFDFSPYSKLDNLSNLYIGSMYQSGGEWVKRPAVNLAKHSALTTDVWTRLEFSLKELGVTASNPDIGGIYFLFNDVHIDSKGKTWKQIAYAYDMSIVSSVGLNSKSSIPANEGDSVNILTDTGLAVKASAGFPTTTSTGATVKNFGSWSKGVVAANNPAAIGDVGFYNLPSASAFTSALTGNIEDYEMELTFTKGASNAYIENIEVGLGNANGTSGYTSLPTVVKTVPILDIDPTFNYTSAANGTEWTISVKVKDILNNGNETRFPGTGNNASKPINDLTGDNINLFTVTGTYRMASSATASMLKFSSIKLVSSPVTLTDTTTSGGNISWAPASSTPLCYSVFKSDGTKLCDTTDTTVANTKSGAYSVYAYYGDNNYSQELVITQTGTPTNPSITYDGTDLTFDFGDFGGEATLSSVAILAEYTDNYNVLESISIMPIRQAVNNIITVPVASMTNKRAFILKDFDSLMPLTAAYPAQ